MIVPKRHKVLTLLFLNMEAVQSDYLAAGSVKKQSFDPYVYDGKSIPDLGMGRRSG